MKAQSNFKPTQNFQQGLFELDIPELGDKISGKVRDIWNISGNRKLIVTTDRQSAYDRMICTVPHKGEVLNQMAAYWFNNSKPIIENHLLAVPHPNVSIVRSVQTVLPVEVVLRRYLAKSATATSIYYNYFDQNRRKIYGLKFPNHLQPNQEFPMGTIITPTTKYLEHDEELDDEAAKKMVDSNTKPGTWEATKRAALKIFELGSQKFLKSGLILVDTKYEFGIDEAGKLILIDELHTPDSSRLWLASSYKERFQNDEDPENFDKEIIRKWLAEHGFRGEGQVPVVDRAIIKEMTIAYVKPYEMVTAKKLVMSKTDIPTIKHKILKAI